MICVICQETEVVGQRTSVRFERGEFRLVINDVPARVCPSCGEAYVDEDVTAQLLRIADELSEAGIRDDRMDYDGLPPG
jgi:YgiT-type zinc finger domain-containing protein